MGKSAQCILGAEALLGCGFPGCWDRGQRTAGYVGGPLKWEMHEDTIAQISRCLSDVFCPH